MCTELFRACKQGVWGSLGPPGKQAIYTNSIHLHLPVAPPHLNGCIRLCVFVEEAVWVVGTCRTLPGAEQGKLCDGSSKHNGQGRTGQGRAGLASTQQNPHHSHGPGDEGFLGWLL
jgi:hypothetical protein